MESEIIAKLFEIEAIRFGEFKLKTGLISPIYFNLRVIIGYPDLLCQISELLQKAANDAGASFDLICGVPYTALPLATCISIKHNKPMVIRRKEAKDYGTRQMIEGVYKAGQTCLVVEDVVTSGGSVLETVEELKHAGIKTTDAVVLLDRGQGGKERLSGEGINLHGVLHIETVMEVLLSKKYITHEVYESVYKFLKDNKFEPKPKPYEKRIKTLTYSERSKLATNSTSKKLFKIMEEKKTNLAFSVDVTNSEEVLRLADLVGPYICILKTHIDIITNFSPNFTKALIELATKHNFIIFEDRKFADIGNTVAKQYSEGIYHIKDWAEITNAHIVPGDGVIQGLKTATNDQSRGCLLIAQMSAKGALTDEKYTKAAVKMASENPDFVIGFICTNQVCEDPKFIHMTPGVNLKVSGDSLGQQYLTPEEVIGNRLCDVIIVGRGIYNAENPENVAKEYKEVAFKAYLDRIHF